MEQAGFYLEETDERRNLANVLTAKQAEEPEGRFVVDFYVFESEESAASGFTTVKNEFESMSGNTRAGTNTPRVYRYTTNGMYFAVVRIDNTLIRVETEADNRDAVNEALDIIGYR
jgi:hypothetical protein